MILMFASRAASAKGLFVGGGMNRAFVYLQQPESGARTTQRTCRSMALSTSFKCSPIVRLPDVVSVRNFGYSVHRRCRIRGNWRVLYSSSSGTGGQLVAGQDLSSLKNFSICSLHFCVSSPSRIWKRLAKWRTIFGVPFGALSFAAIS